MKHSEFESALRTAFGPLGPSLAADLVLEGLGRTADEALADGVRPQTVWDALWRTTELSEDLRFPHRAERRQT